jgi:transposase-like protein
MAKGKYHEWLGPDGLLKLEAWARDGLVDEQIAENMGIHPSTLYEWKKKHPEINEALKKGKEVVDIQVENALLKRAMGYTFEEVIKERTPIRYEDGKPVEWEMQVTKKVLKEVQPDVTAQIFWLKNRKPVEWRDKQEIDIAGKDGKPFEVNIKVVD